MEECKEANVLRAKLRQAESTVAELSAAATSHDNALIIKSLKRKQMFLETIFVYTFAFITVKSYVFLMFFFVDVHTYICECFATTCQ